MKALQDREAIKKLPDKKQRMIRVNVLMQRTVVNMTQRALAKAFRAWREYALRDKRRENKKYYH
jgi:hypothetical protein